MRSYGRAATKTRSIWRAPRLAGARVQHREQAPRIQCHKGILKLVETFKVACAYYHYENSNNYEIYVLPPNRNRGLLCGPSNWRGLRQGQGHGRIPSDLSVGGRWPGQPR